ncbi:hypothetical protein AQSSE16_07530 [Streptococcus equi subsp. equi]|uniref:hypothetical protein n=1 Tax=Streptococcus equi TaxID=1336 RepID=UPI0002F3873B|nr:hypothetical protein [Streptococcus equi]MBT1195605.1 hypothetical protein [Streptococcus equi subsp. equi]MBT1211545.1 hypothetical protein [Streptococcus equi subsp. equi]MBT1214898.1 hypothetical protein [Streptococcus equi subsp. equi]MBT1245605.1 hypothetical protein [Streptococcus equi subsp. equi]MCD3475087.1 hypothetical protein [Streptococcus equi subsp. equi]
MLRSGDVALGINAGGLNQIAVRLEILSYIDCQLDLEKSKFMAHKCSVFLLQ